jgi:hypothetical protein
LPTHNNYAIGSEVGSRRSAACHNWPRRGAGKAGSAIAGRWPMSSDFSGYPCPSASDLDGLPRFPANFDAGIYHLWPVRSTEFIPFHDLCQANAVGAVLQSGPRVPPGVRHEVLAVRTRGPYNGDSSGPGCKWRHFARRRRTVILSAAKNPGRGRPTEVLRCVQDDTFFQRRTEIRKSHTINGRLSVWRGPRTAGRGQRRTSTAWRR